MVLMTSIDLRADDRFRFEPSLVVSEVTDNNLNFSIEEPLSDRVQRVSPTLALRFNSPRWRITGAYGVDSERYMKYSTLDSNRARERAAVGIQYQAAPRLRLSMDGAYINTSTPADLNVDTGLGASRVRGQLLSVGSSVRFEVSPRTVATVSTSTSGTNVVNGIGMRSQGQAFILGHHVTPRDLFNVHYEHIDLGFRGVSSQRIKTQFLLGRWIHEFGIHDRVTLQAGPRVTNGSTSVDVAAILAHTWQYSSIALSFLRNQTTAIGYAGTVDTQTLQTRISFTPNRRLTAYTQPAVIRSTSRPFEATVYRLSAGARYAISSLFDATVAYNHDSQKGAFDPMRPDANLSRATLSFGFAARWNNPESTR